MQMERRERTQSTASTFVTIATGRYLDFWKSQILSAMKFLDQNSRIEFVLLTDQVQAAEVFRDEVVSNTRWLIKIAFVEHQDWPFPTLYKFKYILRHSELLTGNLIWHLDADMLFADNNIVDELNWYSRENKMILVSHPGYYRPRGTKIFSFYLFNPDIFLRDIKSIVKTGGIGSWEIDSRSLAYVERRNRRRYLCGGSWGGNKDLFLNFSRLIAHRIDNDYQSGVIARFHDESHINWYAANYECEIVTPSYCFEETYENLKGLPMKIIAVNKNSSAPWER